MVKYTLEAEFVKGEAQPLAEYGAGGGFRL